MKRLFAILPVLMLIPAVISMPAHAEAVVTVAAEAPAQARAGDTAAATDSTMAAADSAGTIAGTGTFADSASAVTDSMEVNKLTFTSKSTIEFTESDKRAETGFVFNYMAGNGWIINSNLTVGKRSYRGRDMDAILESYMNSASKVEPNVYILNILMAETFNSQTSLALARYGKELVFRKQSAGFNFTLHKPLLKASKSLIFVSEEGSRGLQDYKFNTTSNTAAGGHFNYLLGDRVRVSAGVGTNIRHEESSVEYIVFDWMPSHSDTMNARFVVGNKNETNLVDISYSRRMGTIREIQPPYGNTMEIIDDPEAAYEERNDNKGEILTIESATKITDRVMVNVSFNRDYSDERFMIEDRRNKEYESKKIDAGITFKYHKSGSMGVKVKRAETDTELGPTSIASFRTADYSLNGNLTQSFSDSLTLYAEVSTSLNQKFFKKREQNPRDVDYLKASFDCRLEGYLFKKIKTEIDFSTLRSETINIDASLSEDNRVDFQYLLSPKLILDPVSWITLWQKYEIKLDYTEYTFDTDRNYLNRNTSLETDAIFRMFNVLRLGINHKYQMKDTGSYLSRYGGEKLYGPSNENFEHWMRMRCEYSPVKDMLIFVRTSYKTQKSNILGMLEGKRQVISSSGSDSGDLRMGFERSRGITDSGKLDLNVAYVKRYAPFLTEDRKQYWEIRTNFTLNF